jgi:hypothetical protein
MYNPLENATFDFSTAAKTYDKNIFLSPKSKRAPKTNLSLCPLCHSPKNDCYQTGETENPNDINGPVISLSNNREELRRT